MKSKFLVLLLLAAAAIPARAIEIAKWTFEINTPPDLSNSATSPTTGVASETGTGTVSGVHARSQTDWSTPAGNASANAFSANEWTLGDYYQFQISAVGYQDITVSWDQTRSSTGPGVWDFAYSLDGTTFTIASDNYSVSAISWSSSGIPNLVSRISLNLSALSALDNASAVYFRIISDSAASDMAGTSRVDNFIVSGERYIPPPKVPDTGTSFALLALPLLGLWTLRRFATQTA